jgi:hypothetical protein
VLSGNLKSVPRRVRLDSRCAHRNLGKRRMQGPPTSFLGPMPITLQIPTIFSRSI